MAVGGPTVDSLNDNLNFGISYFRLWQWGSLAATEAQETRGRGPGSEGVSGTFRELSAVAATTVEQGEKETRPQCHWPCGLSFCLGSHFFQG